MLVFITNIPGQSRFRAKCPTILTFNQLVHALDLGQLAVRLLYRAVREGEVVVLSVSCVHNSCVTVYAVHAYSRGFNDKQCNERAAFNLPTIRNKMAAETRHFRFITLSPFSFASYR